MNRGHSIGHSSIDDSRWSSPIIFKNQFSRGMFVTVNMRKFSFGKIITKQLLKLVIKIMFLVKKKLKKNLENRIFVAGFDFRRHLENPWVTTWRHERRRASYLLSRTTENWTNKQINQCETNKQNKLKAGKKEARKLPLIL